MAWEGNAALDPDRYKDDDLKRLNVHVHPNAVQTEFTEWSIISPNSMVDQFAVGATINDTVTPPNPTPPTNIPSWGETPPSSAEMIAAAQPDDPEELSIKTHCLEAGDPQDPTLFAPPAGSQANEAAGTEEVITRDIVSGEDTVTIPVVVTAGVVAYTLQPNLTHPSNPEFVPEPPPLPENGGTSAVYDDEWEKEDDDANEVTKPRSSRNKKGRK